MTTISIRSPMACLLLLVVSSGVCAQAGSGIDSTTGRRSEKLATNKVPRVVTEIFNKQYPVIQDGNWYGYPPFENGSDWYEYDPSYFSNRNPENYVVEFTHHDTVDRVLYAKNGRKIATHRRMNTPIPKEITDAIQHSTYKNWTMGNDKEEVFKDAGSDQIKVYRVTVRNGKQRHTLYFQNNGKLLKIIKSVEG